VTFEGLPVTLSRRRGQRNVRLAIRNRSIVVSGPWWASNKDLLAFLEDHREWVQKTIAKKETRTRELLDEPTGILPDLLYLGVAHPVEIIEDQAIRAGHAHISVEDGTVKIRYPLWDPTDLHIPENIDEAKRIISQWLLDTAKTHLTRRTNELAHQHGFVFERLFIRSQTTKWGTCSSKRNLSLNRKLIQCPSMVIDYLIIHELCHLREMNHSKAYWALVADHYPNYREAEMWLKRYGNVVFGNY
jgi:predicted metal-dependent hydrolase